MLKFLKALNILKTVEYFENAGVYNHKEAIILKIKLLLLQLSVRAFITIEFYTIYYTEQKVLAGVYLLLAGIFFVSYFIKMQAKMKL